MSHFSYIKTQVKDLSALLEVLTSFKFVPEIYLNRAEIGRRALQRLKRVEDLIPPGEEEAIETLYATAASIAKTLNCSIEEILIPVPLYGYQGDRRRNVAHVRIPRKQISALGGGACNDLGFVFDPESGEYQLIISDYDRTNPCGPLGATFGTRLNVGYTRAISLRAVEAQGWEVVEDSIIDGKTMRIRVRKKQVKTSNATTSRRKLQTTIR